MEAIGAAFAGQKGGLGRHSQRQSPVYIAKTINNDYIVSTPKSASTEQ
jgi:hypothetical protein